MKKRISTKINLLIYFRIYMIHTLTELSEPDEIKRA